MDSACSRQHVEPLLTSTWQAPAWWSPCSLTQEIIIRDGQPTWRICPERGRNKQLDYVLTPTGNNWRIVDIRYRPGEVSFSLRKFLEGLPDQR